MAQRNQSLQDIYGRQSNRVVLAASIAEDLRDLELLYAFGEMTHAEYLNASEQMRFRLHLVLEGKEVWDA